jgi:curved DNA-binding protein CbpA
MQQMDKPECYRVLGLEEDAAAAEVKAAYRDLAKVWHPDRFTSDPRLQERALEMMKRVNLSYDALQLGNYRATKRAAPAHSPPRRTAPAANDQPTEPQPVAGTPKPRTRYVGFWEGLAALLGGDIHR